jgi:energy-coupling factor transport system permease protein
MTAFIDLYSEGDTFLHRLDPRVKMIAVLTLSLLAFILSELTYLLCLLAFVFVLMALARASWARTFFAMKFVLRFMALIVIMWPLFDRSGTPVLASLGPIAITEPGVLNGLTSAVRVGCLAMVWYILIFTTAQRDLVRALVKMGVRFDFGLTLAITLRFFPSFSVVIASIMDAQRARGLDFSKGGLMKRSKNYVAVLAPAVVTSLRTAQALSLALLSRAYGARSDRTYLRELRMRPLDYVALAVVISLLALPALAKYVLGMSL